MAHSIRRWLFGSGGAAAWMILLMGADCGGYYPSFEEIDGGDGIDGGGSIVEHPFGGDAFVDRTRSRFVGAWEVFPVTGQGADAPQLAIEPTGVLHLVSVRHGSGEVLHTFGTPADFRTELAGHQRPDENGAGRASQLLADGTLHLAFSFDGRGGVTHAVRAVDGTWASEPLPFDEGPLGSAAPAIARKPDGSVLFVGSGPLRADGQRDVRVLDETVQTIGDGVDSAQLFLAAVATRQGTTHVLFTTDGPLLPASLVLATRVGDTWLTRALPRSTLGAPASLAADADGVLHVVYVDSNGYVIHSVGGADTTPTEELVGTPGGPTALSMALDADAHLHVVVASSADLAYATNRSGSWVWEHLDDAPARAPSIAIDAAGTPWVAYDDAGGALVVAHRMP